MEASVIENKKTTKIILNNFRVSKNIPIDERFLISSLDAIDIEIPLKRRYNGLIFFVVDSVINDGVDDILSGVLYCFENDLTNPIPLHETVLRHLIYQVSVENENYSELDITLNKTFPKPGKTIHVKGLDVVYIYNDTVSTWEYFSGVYKVSSDAIFDMIPNQLKSPGKLVIVDDGENPMQRKLISENLTLIDEVYVSDDIPTNPEDDHYYIVNGFVYYAIMGSIFKLSDKIFTIDVNLEPGDNNIIHNLGSTYILPILRINNNNENPDIKEGIMQLNIPYLPISENEIVIESRMFVNATIILIAK